MPRLRRHHPALALLLAYVLFLQALAVGAAQTRLLSKQIDPGSTEAVMALCLPGMERAGDPQGEGGVHAPCCALSSQLLLASPPATTCDVLVLRDAVRLAHHPRRHVLPVAHAPPAAFEARGPPSLSVNA